MRADDKRQFNKGRAPGSKNVIQGEIKKKTPAPNSRKATFRDDSTIASKEFLKVRANESQEEWEKRTKKKRVYGRSKNNNIKIANNGSLIVNKRYNKGRDRDRKLQIVVRFHERPFDFLKVYSFIMRWANVKYRILKDDLELGYYFYEGTPFTKEEFEYVCTQLGAVRGVFSRFVKNSYVTNITIITASGVVRETEYFQLTNAFNHVLKCIYGAITKTSKLNTSKYHCKGKLSEELLMELEKMNDEITEILEKENKN